MNQFAPERFCKYYVLSLEEGEKRKINPFSVYKDIQDHLGGEPESMTSMGKDKLLITVRN